MAACGCRNGRGGQKVMHKTREAAVNAAMSPRYLKSGLGHTPYPCPKVKGVWHLRTEKKRLG